MFVRAWFTMLLLTSYLLIAGTGFINAPDEPRYAVADSHAHQVHHHQDRYSDFDGMDLGLDELPDLAVQSNTDATTPDGQPSLKITGIDAHCLPGKLYFPFLSGYQTNESAGDYLAVTPTALARIIDAPPW